VSAQLYLFDIEALNRKSSKFPGTLVFSAGTVGHRTANSSHWPASQIRGSSGRLRSHDLRSGPSDHRATFSPRLPLQPPTAYRFWLTDQIHRDPLSPDFVQNTFFNLWWSDSFMVKVLSLLREPFLPCLSVSDAPAPSFAPSKILS